MGPKDINKLWKMRTAFLKSAEMPLTLDGKADGSSNDAIFEGMSKAQVIRCHLWQQSAKNIAANMAAMSQYDGNRARVSVASLSRSEPGLPDEARRLDPLPNEGCRVSARAVRRSYERLIAEIPILTVSSKGGKLIWTRKTNPPIKPKFSPMTARSAAWIQ